MPRRQVLLGGAAASVATTGSERPESNTIVFGGSVPLSGPAAETGLNVNNGYLTAVSYLNDVIGGVEIGGEKYRLELKLFDDASDPARATTLLQRQIDEGTQFFLGSFGSNIVLPTAAIVERARKLMVQTGGGSDQIFNQGFTHNFGMYPRASRQFETTATLFASLQPKPATFSVILTNDAFSRTAATGAIKSCTAAGIKLLDRLELPEKVTDVSSILGSVRGNLPDVLICVTHDQDSLLIARQMIASGTNVKLLFQGLGPQLASYRQALGKYARRDRHRLLLDRGCAVQGQVLRHRSEIRRLLPQQIHPPDRLSYRRRRRLHPDLCAGDAGREEHSPGSGARGNRGGRFRDVLQPHQIYPAG